jgi:FkbM family methyltransferase
MNIAEILRTTANRFGIDICRIGRERLGRNLAMDLAALSPQQGLIFDVGANTGRAARFFASAFPASQIWSFEPGQEAFAALASAGDLAKVRKFKIALSDQDGEATLNLFSGSELNSLLPRGNRAELHIDPASFAPTGTEAVETVRLDTFCAQNQVPELGILKIDTQGFEMHVLRGAERMLKEGRVHVIQLEINFSPLYSGQPQFSEIFDCLTKFDYGLIALYDAQRAVNGCLKWCDAVFRLNRPI